jgi:hypothetical protein
MKQSNQDNLKYFPRLNIDKLKIIAKRWADDYDDVPIDRIVLYPYASKYQKYFNTFVEKKYVIIFEISAEDEIYGLVGKARLDHDMAVVRGEVPSDPLYKFILATEQYTSIIQDKKFLAFITKDFEDVYLKEPNENFRSEWMFVARPLVYNPKKDKIMPMGLLSTPCSMLSALCPLLHFYLFSGIFWENDIFFQPGIDMSKYLLQKMIFREKN